MVGNGYIQGRQEIHSEGWVVAELEEWLLSIHEALASIPSTAQTRYGSSYVQLGRRIRMSVFKVSLNYKLISRLIWTTSDHVFKKEVGGGRGGRKGKYTQILKSSPKVVALSKSPKHTCKAGYHVKTRSNCSVGMVHLSGFHLTCLIYPVLSLGKRITQ